MSFKEILNKLPSNWQQLKLKDYIKLSPVISDKEEDTVEDSVIFTKQYLSELEKNILVISLLTDTHIDVIEALTMVQLNEMVSKLNFLHSSPEAVKSSIKYKEFNQLSYDDFITFSKLSREFTEENILNTAIENLPLMLSVFSTDKLEPEYFLELSIPEVIAGFFIVRKNTERYLRSLKASTLKQLMKIQMNQLKNLLIFWFRKINPFKRYFMKSGMIGR